MEYLDKGFDVDIHHNPTSVLLGSKTCVLIRLSPWKRIQNCRSWSGVANATYPTSFRSRYIVRYSDGAVGTERVTRPGGLYQMLLWLMSMGMYCRCVWPFELINCLYPCLCYVPHDRIETWSSVYWYRPQDIIVDAYWFWINSSVYSLNDDDACLSIWLPDYLVL